MFSAAKDGSVVKWDVSRYKTGQIVPLYSACDHRSAVVSLDASDDLDIVASASTDGTVALRMISNSKLVRFIHVPQTISGAEYAVSHVRLSPQGYVVLVVKPRNSQTELNDHLLVYGINGELVRCAETADSIGCILLDETGYFAVTGGASGRLSKYDILALDEVNLLNDLDAGFPGLERSLQELLSSGASITALALTKKENCQQLLIGLSSGELLAYKYSPRLAGGKIFDALQGLIIGKS